MRGSIYRRNKAWTVVYDGPPAEDGSRRQKSKGGFPTRKAASAFLTKTLASIGSGTYAEPSKLTLADYLTNEWLPNVEPTMRPGSFTTYEFAVRCWIVPHIGGVKLQQLTGGHLTRLHHELAQDGRSISTTRLAHWVLSRALGDAERWGRVPRNVAKLADPPAPARTRATAWTATELRRFMEEAAETDRLSALWRLAATTGMRRGELLGLTWQALDLDGGRLSVEQQLVQGQGGVRFGPPKSERSRRTVALDPETVAVLRQHREAQAVERTLGGSDWQDGDLVFPDELGRPLQPRRVSRRFVALRKKAGIPTGTLHTLRHTATPVALTSGVPLHVVAARLGDNPQTLLSTYAHLPPSSDELAAETMAQMLAG